MRGSDLNSSQRSSGSSEIPSRPVISASHVDSGVSPAFGKRVEKPTIAMSSSGLRSRSQNASSSLRPSSGSPSMIRLASEAIVGCW